MYAISSVLFILAFVSLSIAILVFITNLLPFSTGAIFLNDGNGLFLFSFKYCNLFIALINALLPSIPSNSSDSIIALFTLIKFWFLPPNSSACISIVPLSTAIACTSTPSADSNDSSVNSGVFLPNLIPSAWYTSDPMSFLIAAELTNPLAAFSLTSSCSVGSVIPRYLLMSPASILSMLPTIACVSIIILAE